MRDWLIRSDANRGIWIPWALELSREVETDILLAYRIAARRADAEISGIGRVTEREGNTFLISEIIIPNQVDTGGDTDFLGEEMTAALNALAAEQKDPAEFNFWWHSHVTGRAQFSSIDDEMIANRLIMMMNDVHMNFDSDIPEETMSGPFLSLVGNVYGKMTVRCDFLHRMGKEYRQYTFAIPVIRHLAGFSKEELDQIFEERHQAIDNIIEERVVFGRSRGFLGRHSFGELEVLPAFLTKDGEKDGDDDLDEEEE